jgi:zinc protease
LQKLAVLFLIPLLMINVLGQTPSTTSTVNQANILKKTLDNGVTVLLIEDHTAPVISCQVYSKMGTRDEAADADGAAFLIARSALGSVDYSYREGTGLMLERDETASAIINKDFIGLLLRGSMDKLDSLVERASSFANYESLNRDFAIKHKTVLDQTVTESNSMAGSGESLKPYTYDRLFETAYGSEGDGRRLVGGSDAVKLTEYGFLKFAAQVGAPEKLLVVIAGDFEPTYTMLLSNRWFGHRQAAKPPVDKHVELQRAQEEVRVVPDARKKEARLRPAPQPQPVKIEKPAPPTTETEVRPPAARLDLKLPVRDDVLAIGFRVAGADNPDFAGLSVLAAVLGGGQSSILATRFMTRDSVDYRADELSCRLGPYGTTKAATLFSVYLREPKSPYYSIWQSENFINNEITKLKQNPIDPTQINTAKKLLLAEYRRQTESIDGRAYAVSLGFLRTGDTASADNYVSSIQSVTASDLQIIANKYLTEANRTAITIVGVSLLKN